MCRNLAGKELCLLTTCAAQNCVPFFFQNRCKQIGYEEEEDSILVFIFTIFSCFLSF